MFARSASQSFRSVKVTFSKRSCSVVRLSRIVRYASIAPSYVQCESRGWYSTLSSMRNAIVRSAYFTPYSYSAVVSASRLLFPFACV